MALAAALLVKRPQQPLILLANRLGRRFASNCEGKGAAENACCGSRQDCKHPPCKPEEQECYYATRARYPCKPWTFRDRCDYNPCHLLPRFDWLYYRTGDKGKRQYQKTWTDCPPKTHKKCCYTEVPDHPPIFRRSKKMRQDLSCRSPTACEKDGAKFNQVCKINKSKKDDRCPWMDAPFCPEAQLRKPPCNKFRGLLDCPKPCCPYPSYSECCIAGMAEIPGRSVQCGCLGPPISWCHATRIISKLSDPPKKD